jgi:hypothetical protein
MKKEIRKSGAWKGFTFGRGGFRGPRGGNISALGGVT